MITKRAAAGASIWGHFPSEEDAQRPLARCFIQQTQPPGFEYLKAPYQPTLYVLAYLYHQLHREANARCREQADLFAQGDGFAGPPPRGPDGVDLEWALNSAPLRAVAYFSWESDKRSFLARRVFPPYFDFLSYSHVPAGWGALGIMLDELTSAVANGTTIPAFSTVLQVRGRQQLLPYLREVDRLKYESVLVVPVTDPTAPLALLRGAIAFYLHRADCLPAESGEFSIRVSRFSQLLQDHVEKHVSSLNPGTFKTLGQIVG